MSFNPRVVEIKAKDLQPEIRKALDTDVEDNAIVKVRVEVVDETSSVGRRAIDILGEKVDRLSPKGTNIDIEALVREWREA